MKRLVTTVVAAALAAVYGSVPAATAQDQEVRQIECVSGADQRSSCSSDGEVVNAGIINQYSEVPCILGYTWGFEQNGIWVANGCSANFALTVVSRSEQGRASPERVRERLREARDRIRTLRKEVQQEREERKRIESELSKVQAKLAQSTRRRDENDKDFATRSVAACGAKATREQVKIGAERAIVVEIIHARPIEGTWLVAGRTLSVYGDERRPTFFRCWVNKGEIQSFETGM